MTERIELTDERIKQFLAPDAVPGEPVAPNPIGGLFAEKVHLHQTHDWLRFSLDGGNSWFKTWRLAGVPDGPVALYTAPVASRAGSELVAHKWTDADAEAWGTRHDVRLTGGDLFCAFEDAASLPPQCLRPVRQRRGSCELLHQTRRRDPARTRRRPAAQHDHLRAPARTVGSPRAP